MFRSRPITTLLVIALSLVLVFLGRRVGHALGTPEWLGTLLLAFVFGTIAGSIGVIRANRR